MEINILLIIIYLLNTHIHFNALFRILTNQPSQLKAVEPGPHSIRYNYKTLGQ
jgi:hypothetical protein